MKKIKIFFGVVLFVSFSLFTNETTEAQTINVCPGSGESCNAEITFGGDTVKVKSVKNKGGGTIVITQQ
jgi:hypothetical protein